MQLLLSIDLGTSGVKAVVIDTMGHLLATGTQPYPIDTPQVGWAEQSPVGWWQATIVAVRQALAQVNGSVAAIGLSGQMHGTVLLDRSGEPLGQAIIWADQRSVDEVQTIETTLGLERLRQVGTRPATGFMGATLLWIKRHQPERLEQARVCLLPKDYLRYQLTGELATDVTDASATGLFDIRRRQWASELIAQLGLPEALLPPVLEPNTIVGTLTAAAAAALGLAPNVPVVAGCADQVAQSIGSGLLTAGQVSITLGSGGQVFAPLTQPYTDPALAIHTFCHAPQDQWYLLGAMLTAGLSLRWLRDFLGWQDQPDAFDRLSALAASVPVGAEGLLYLPYLAGERSPLMDPLARGALVGLTLRHSQGHVARAVMEGVAFALRHILETMQPLGVNPSEIWAAGNGLRSSVWRQIVADVLNRPLLMLPDAERTGIGAALLAGLGVGLYPDYPSLQAIVTQPSTPTAPSLNAAEYDDGYARFIRAYPALKGISAP